LALLLSTRTDILASMRGLSFCGVILSLSVASLGCAAVTGLDGLDKVDECAQCGDTGLDATVGNDTAAGDSAVSDGARDTATGDAADLDTRTDDADATAKDTAAADTLGIDTRGIDTAVLDTAVVDTAVADTTDAGIVCPSAEGPSMVLVPGGYCIDSTEVTNAQYARFLAASVSTATQPAECSWNTTYTPSFGWPASSGEDVFPVGSVDWCDARAYCQWAGKRLCGHPGSGPTPYAAYSDSSQSEWFAACSAGGTKTYPYGNTYNATACQGADIKPNKLVPVGSKSTCVGGYGGIFDMSGNVYEWEDSCAASTGAADNCHMRGGGEFSFSTNLQCGSGVNDSRNAAFVNLGIRCCAF
jgi:formylglycine-generating enzyme